MAFLRARFPAVLGMNVLWSLALFSEWHQTDYPALHANTGQSFFSSCGTATSGAVKSDWKTSVS
jgi:hypothetical protein